MATVSKLGQTWDTNAGNKTVTATPAVDDLIVVVAGASGMAGADDISIADNQGGVYTRVARSTGGGTTGMMDIWIRNALVASAVSTIYTATITGDTGGGLTVLKVTGMARTGSAASLQIAQESTQTESPVVATFPAPPLTGNPCIAGVLGEDNPAALGPPNSGGATWTETTDTGWATPATGIHVSFISSGETDASITWTAGAFTDHNEVMVELDTSPASITYTVTGGAIGVTVAQGNVAITYSRPGGAIAVTVAQGGLAAQYSRIGGGESVTVAQGGRAIILGRVGGAIAVTVAQGNTPVSITYEVTGGGESVTVAQGGRAVTYQRASTGTAITLVGGTQTITYQVTGGGVAIGMAGGLVNVNIAKAGGAITVTFAAGISGQAAVETPAAPMRRIVVDDVAVHGRPGKIIITISPEVHPDTIP